MATLLISMMIGGCGKTETKVAKTLNNSSKNITADEKDKLEQMEKNIQKFLEEEANKKENEKDRDEGKEEESTSYTIDATYLSLSENNQFSYVFASEQSGVFVIATKESEYVVVDEEEKEIKLSDLKMGDKVSIDSSGMMMESYPGQLAGVNKITVVGTDENVEQYQSIIDGLTNGIGGLGEIDGLNEKNAIIEYKTSLSITSVVASTNDEKNILAWDDIIDVVLEDETDLTINFTETPKDASVRTYSVEDMGSGEIKEASDVAVEMIDGSLLIKKAQHNLIYQINATYEDEEVIFGFYTK